MLVIKASLIIQNFPFLGISGVAIGSGWQGVVAYVNLATYYVIGLPIGCVLGFKTSLGVAVSLISPSLSVPLIINYFCLIKNGVVIFRGFGGG